MGDSQIRSAYATHIGKTRQYNEDSVCFLPEQRLWMIADGMGGHLGGKLASTHVIDEVQKQVQLGKTLRQAIADTHHTIKELVRQGHGPKGMGSTVVALSLKENRYEICWVGDSRAYLWDRSSLVQLTRDHSFVQELVDSGVINEHEALAHPQRHIISRALGSDSYQEIQVDSISGRLSPGDTILLCSDGLTTELSGSEISQILSLKRSFQDSVDLLVQKANEKGGRDNITAILIVAPSAIPQKEPVTTKPVAVLTEALSPLQSVCRIKYRIVVWLSVLLIILICLLFFTIGRDTQEDNDAENVHDPVQDTVRIKKTYIPLNNEEHPKKKGIE